MSKIIKLDKNLSNQIAAWEVVERPVSIIKELVENSIDAWSTNIKIEITEWWKKEIIVRDNGYWIDKEDLKLSLEKYTTSKIKSIEDLYNIMTFGFRWEALSSISSVSKLKIISKTQDSISAYSIESIWWEMSYLEEDRLDKWTKIIVKDLFFNTPARLNYLKKDRTEYSHILDFLYKIVLSYPKIGFEFLSNNKQIFKFSKNENIKNRIYKIYGEEFLNSLIDIKFSFNGLDINWYITDPKTSFTNKNRQVLFVNKRIISSPIIYKAIINAYNRFIAPKTFPWFIINLQINPTEIDVNVHPRKKEIRFASEQNIFRWIYNAVEWKLSKVSLVNEKTFDSFLSSQKWQELNKNDILWNKKIETKNYYIGSGTKFKSYSPYKDVSQNPAQWQIQEAVKFSKEILSSSKDFEKENNWFKFNNNDLHYTSIWKIVWQIHNSYIIVETKLGIKIIDQHALAERIIFEKLKRKKEKDYSQKLLFPISLNLTPKELDIIKEHLKIFINIWFEIEFMSNGIIIINLIPNFIIKEKIKSIFLWIINDLLKNDIKKLKTLEEVQNKVFAYTACRSAIKFGNKLTLFEINKLLNDSILSYSSTCPHWRPVVFDIWLEELKWKYNR